MKNSGEVTFDNSTIIIIIYILFNNLMYTYLFTYLKKLLGLFPVSVNPTPQHSPNRYAYKSRLSRKFKRVSLNETHEFPFWGLYICVVA